MNSTLENINWTTMTTAQAKRLRVLAAVREKSIVDKFNSGKVSEAELLAACQLEENLQVFSLTGVYDPSFA